jgi:hypothetical protein
LVLSFFFIIPVLRCHFFVIYIAFCCHLVVIFSSFFAILLSFLCHLFVIFVSFSYPARVAGSGAELESPKTQFHQHAGHFFFVIFLSFSQASGEGGKPGLRKCKKHDKKITPGLGNAKNMQKDAKKMQKKDSRAGKVAFFEFPGRPRFPALSRPPGPFHPGPSPPTRFLSRPPPKPAP